ncbi:Pectinesterase, catalytic [Dillenia turbinata]|uniref:pectinesterase n=1 Tax=Dillenia turbinata TaxID=194707 RepID=A0AAN8UHI5_9MAGN
MSTATANLSFHPTQDDLPSTEETPTSKLPQKAILQLLNTKCTTSIHYLKQTHALVIRTDNFQDNFISGSLVKCYANPHFNSLDIALKVFTQVPQPNTFLWNCLTKGYLENDEPFEVLSLYGKMVVSNSRPNKFTYPTVFNACAHAEAIEVGLQVHAHVAKHGLRTDKHIKSAGIQMYASIGLVFDARRMLDEEGETDVICWNAMIDGYLRFGEVEAAKRLFESMPQRNIGSWNVMISGLARCGLISEARELFNCMPERDDISWSTMIDACNKEGYFKEALEVFSKMQSEKVVPKRFVLSSVLAACANLGALDQGRWVHSYAKKNFMKLDAVLGTSLVDMYAKCGRLDSAWEVFENMNQKAVYSWNAMIGGLAMNGRAEDAIELFFKMRRENIRPNAITFVCVLNAFAHAGLVDEGLLLFESMKEMYDVEPEVEHYGCVVDLLGRAGLLAEAEELINLMPMEPNAAVWGALLGACRIYGDAELGARVGKHLLELEPCNSGRYVLLSNIYAKAGRWDDVGKLRKLMKERNIKTNPGISMIELGGVVHQFMMGDDSHPQRKQIYPMVEGIVERLKLEGYVPKTSEVLFDIDEEEKETALCYHSEKLAIAFGLLNTPTGASIRIVKNLRVCEDCHSATKLISLVYNRQIIVRDRVRYHHFRNGTCSCNDFWIDSCAKLLQKRVKKKSELAAGKFDACKMSSPLCWICFSLVSPVAVGNRTAMHFCFGASKTAKIQYTITVDKSGKGNFTEVQKAIDSIPSGNKQWVCVKLAPGIYNEKIYIPDDKPYILLEGYNRSSTIIQYDEHESSTTSSTIVIFTGNFAARKITFKNTYMQPSIAKPEITWAPAATIKGDKVSFLDCAFIGFQDTLTDFQGRHFFRHCFIEGAIDFIWGFAQSVYEKCTININLLDRKNPGFITAQGRQNEKDPSGFVFKYCNVQGGQAYLGRAYREYSRVLFYRSYLSKAIVPQGWDSWSFAGREEHISFGEVENKGEGADTSKRAKWIRDPNDNDVRFLLSTKKFIDKEGWINEQLTLA